LTQDAQYVGEWMRMGALLPEVRARQRVLEGGRHGRYQTQVVRYAIGKESLCIYPSAK